MSEILSRKYLTELARLRQVGGTRSGSMVREACKDLQKNWRSLARLRLISEYELDANMRERHYADGAPLHTLRVPFGYRRPTRKLG